MRLFFLFSYRKFVRKIATLGAFCVIYFYSVGAVYQCCKTKQIAQHKRRIFFRFISYGGVDFLGYELSWKYKIVFFLRLTMIKENFSNQRDDNRENSSYCVSNIFKLAISADFQCRLEAH